MRYDSPTEPWEPDPKESAAYGLSPAGEWVVNAEDLPLLSVPRHVEVRREAIMIDGWVFPMAHVTKGFLIWLQACFFRWLEEDGRTENRRWVEGIAEAFEAGLGGKL